MTYQRFRRRHSIALCALLALGVSTLTTANDDLDVTMRMVQDGEDLTGAVVREIRLPEPARGAAARPATPRDKTERPAMDDRARERGREFGQSVSERAREARDKASDRRPVERPDVVSPDRGRPDRLPDPSSNTPAPSRP